MNIPFDRSYLCSEDYREWQRAKGTQQRQLDGNPANGWGGLLAY